MSRKHENRVSQAVHQRRRRMVAGTVILLALFAAACDDQEVLNCGGVQLVPYMPYVGLDSGELVAKPELLDSKMHIYEFLALFVSLDDPFAYVDGRLFIEKDVAEDKDLIRNLVNKANKYSEELLSGEWQSLVE